MIYVVEDDKSIRNLVEYALREKGYEVAGYEDGSQIVSDVKDSPGELLILDIMLPEKDGITILKEIREFSDIPIIMLTARTDEFDKVMGLDLGADDYIMLLLFMSNIGNVITRDDFLLKVWGYDYEGETRTVDVHIASLRAKLKNAGKYIETVRNLGYKFGEI